MAVGDPSERTLEYTPTWALATVSTVFILISLVVERSLHALGHYLHRSKRKSLNLALQKLKDELMLMGFISLTITIITTPVSKICVKSSMYNKWTPCDIHSRPQAYPPVDGARRRLLATAVGNSYCAEGQEPFVSLNTLHQLHIFIFVLAGVHVTYSCLTMLLALTKVYTWRKWEREAHEAVAQHNETEFTDSVNFSRQSTFVRYHASKPLGVKFLVWVVCLFKQFYVPRADYLTLRLSFVTTHNLRDNYDFHSYMIRCMEDEFETIVGIRMWQWGFVIAYLVFSVTEPNAHFYIAMVPLVVVLIIGMKMQHVIATLALEHSGVKGPYVGVLLKPRDQLFWFNRPKFLLHVIHFIFFESAFELAMFLWHVWQFEFKTCLLEDNKTHLYFRLSIGVVTQLLCCFITLPLYALVSQMSTMPKKAFLPKSVERGLRRWHEDAKRRLKHKVLEKYQNQRLARRREGVITPLDEQYFMQGANNESVLAITDGRHSGRSTPMTLIMEEGTLHDRRSSATNSRNIMAIEGGAQQHQAQNQDQIATFRVSPRLQNAGRGGVEVRMHGHSNDSIRRRASPRSPMNLNLVPFQPREGVPTTPRPPLQRSVSTTH
ncbi:hypothetical protein M758_4G070600 [Ceratodon purpureus]|nr:hypothetical protein M758_4G070600 [Ceratodon purpureus]